MTSETQLLLAFFACTGTLLASWVALRHLVGMAKFKLGLAAGIGALLPFVPDLVKYLHLPPELSNAFCAVVVAVAYKVLPHEDAKPEGAK